VYRTLDTGAPTRSSGRPRPVPIFSATYHFRYPVSVRTPTSSMSPHFAYQANSRLLANTISPGLHNTMRPLSFQNYPVSPNFSEQGRLQSYDYSTQNRFDEPFILDGNLESFCLDDFMTNIHDSPETTHNEMMAQSSSSSSFLKNTRNYVSNLPNINEGDLLLTSPSDYVEKWYTDNIYCMLVLISESSSGVR
jgi:transcriptional enhancer factor